MSMGHVRNILRSRKEASMVYSKIATLFVDIARVEFNDGGAKFLGYVGSYKSHTA
jgi:hypothetical protein